VSLEEGLGKTLFAGLTCWSRKDRKSGNKKGEEGVGCSDAGGCFFTSEVCEKED